MAAKHPESGERLRKIRGTMTVREFISHVWGDDCSPVSNSKMSDWERGRVTLSYDKAKDVIKAFPQYRIEWLMCEDDFELEGDAIANRALGSLRRDSDRSEVNTILAALSGFSISFEFTGSSEVVSLGAAPFESVEFSAITFHGEYTISDGKSSLTISEENMNRIVNETIDFYEFKLNKLFNEK